jgi:hypothetical protein
MAKPSLEVRLLINEKGNLVKEHLDRRLDLLVYFIIFFLSDKKWLTAPICVAETNYCTVYRPGTDNKAFVRVPLKQRPILGLKGTVQRDGSGRN